MDNHTTKTHEIAIEGLYIMKFHGGSNPRPPLERLTLSTFESIPPPQKLTSANTTDLQDTTSTS